EPADIPEEHGGNDPATTACTLAGEKARAIRSRFSGQWILGADTVVVLEGAVLGKPRNRDDARAMLERLGGRDHRVVTGFSILSPSGEEVHGESVATIVRFRPLDRLEIEGYLATGEPFGKAGSYAIQGIGAFMVASISGSYTNVVGLPLCAVIRALLDAGALERFPLPA
ncbi:MAG: Maf family protein, partial [Deltaproteobacteria bacterium]|nr:Maf family protein [Deltaproteobacteria bacterium]